MKSVSENECILNIIDLNLFWKYKKKMTFLLSKNMSRIK